MSDRKRDTIGLTAVIIVRDDADMLAGALRGLTFVDEVVVLVDDRTKDASFAEATRLGTRVIMAPFENFSQFKNLAISHAKSPWVLVIDADERIPHALALEILAQLKRGDADALILPCTNYFFGRRMCHGGWQLDDHIRLFRVDAGHYAGDIHETLVLSPGTVIKRLTTPMAHFSHRSITHNLKKTMQYADVQAAELAANGAPQVRPWHLARVVLREFVHRFLRERGYRDGMPGIIECLYQPFSLFCVHVRLWEMQLTPDLDTRYRRLENEIYD